MKLFPTPANTVLQPIIFFLQKNRSLAKYFSCFLLLILSLSFSNKMHAQTNPNGSAYKNATLTCKITDVQNNTFGYDVFVNGKMTVHQTSIPTIPGNDGFKTQEDAIKVAKLVINKIKKVKCLQPLRLMS